MRTVVGSAVATAAVASLTGLSSASAPASLVSAEPAAAEMPRPIALTAEDIAPSPSTPPSDDAVSAAALEERSLSVSRSAARGIAQYEASSAEFVADPARERVLSSGTSGVAIEVEQDLTQVDPRQVALQKMPEYGLSRAEFGCLDSLWISESDWDMYADNPTSSALGIPQALTSAWDLPADYATNPVSQVEWGLWYIQATYGSACNAWSFKQANNWY